MNAEEYVNSLSLDYSAEFIPQSLSRNADEKRPCINWKVKIGSIKTDYMQGIGHAPNYKPYQRRTLEIAKEEEFVAENGKYHVRLGRWATKTLPEPKLADVLYSLIMDSMVLDYSSFEDWASDFGYEIDSRKAEKMYQDCLAIALKLRNLIDIDAARDAFEDY